MKLSIVIVNYNVRYFLEQCLRSVYRALDGIEAEVFVVDNHSADDSVTMVRTQFPEAKLIANQDNPGFSKANNQAIRVAKGEYILLLNPDTVVEEHTFQKSIDFMDAHPEAGGLGIKMIDGKGEYLPESKRGLPSPWVAFYKIFGLSSIFPRSKRFAKYYLGHLSEDENQEVEILAGAYMMMRKKALDEVGLLDEDFFMYGEDIDLSYRILKGGYKNYYLAESTIIHYKGESTKKGSLNYVRVFYKAMVIFAEKHFSSNYARFYSLFINLAIYLRAGAAVLARILKSISLPLIDVAVLYGGLYYIKEYWEHNHRFIQGGEYPDALMLYAVPAYIAFWVLSLFLNGVYDKQVRISQIFRGLALGSVAILVVYSLIPEEWRFSRAIIILGALWAGLSLIAWRYAWSLLASKPILVSGQRNSRVLLVGEKDELSRVSSLLQSYQPQNSFSAWVSSDANYDDPFVGSIKDLPDLVRVFNIDELIFCSANLSSEAIFKAMRDLKDPNLEFKIAPPESQFIIGSNSIHSQGSWYTQDFNRIDKPENRRAKRLLDLSLALVLIPISPLMIWFMKRPIAFLGNVFAVLLGLKTWVSYAEDPQNGSLPKLPKGVLELDLTLRSNQSDARLKRQLNQLYAKDYRWQKDLAFIWRFLRKLGN
jgi:GT2 family glycosyltransferase